MQRAIYFTVFTAAAVILSFSANDAQASTRCPDGTYVGADSCTRAPDGTYVGGDSYTRCPDGTYVGGDSCSRAPDGTYISGDEYTRCPDGTYVGGDSCNRTPNGDYVGNDRPALDDDEEDDSYTGGDSRSGDREASPPVTRQPKDLWVFCSGLSTQPRFCQGNDSANISVRDEDYEIFGLACGPYGSDELSIYIATVADIDGPKSHDFSLDVQVAGYRNHHISEVTHLPTHRGGSAILKLGIPNSLSRQIASGNRVTVEVYHEQGYSVYTNSFSLKGSAKAIQKLRARCKLDDPI